MVSAYCLDYCNWVCVPKHVREDFKEMVDMGYDTVCLSFSESEMMYSRKTFEILVDIAHKEGLGVHVIPSRLAGRFAGAPWRNSCIYWARSCCCSCFSASVRPSSFDFFARKLILCKSPSVIVVSFIRFDCR